MKEKFPDLSFEIQQDGLILIEQMQNFEPVQIDIHPQQLAHIGRVVFNGKSSTGARVKDLERKISVLTDRIEDLVTDKFIRAELVERSAYGGEILATLDHLYELATEFNVGLPAKRESEGEESEVEANGAEVLQLPTPRKQV